MKTIINDISSRQDFFCGRGILELGCPWLAFGAIMALEHILKKDMMVLELGGGGSTIFFAERTRGVKTLETSQEWVSKITERAKHLSNVLVLYRTEEELVEEIQAQADELYDIILIDIGAVTGKPRPNRLILAQTAIPKLKKGGYLILDNYLKFGNQNFDYSNGWEVYTFDDFGYSGKGTRILRKL